MKKPNITNGEWKVGAPFTSRNKGHIPIVTVNNIITGTIAITTPIKDIATNEDAANALLLAAAPDLAEALYDLLKSYRNYVNNSEQHLINNAISALKKAGYTE